jgi:glycosyltransferase involved in cell wall biosynthesis
MDVVAEMLLQGLRKNHLSEVDATDLRPSFVRRLTRLPLIRSSWPATIGDRLWNRLADYPQWLRAQAVDYDLFHIIDHSYAHLALELPEGRTIVTCHDLDAFAPLWTGDQGIRARLLRSVAKRVLLGLQRAKIIVCPSHATRDQLAAHDLVPLKRVIVVHNGVHPACSAELNPEADNKVAEILRPFSDDNVILLHVGGTVSRKRIDVLLHVFASLRSTFPRVRLVRVGQPFTPAQTELVRTLGLRDSIAILRFLEPDVLAALYRKAAVLLQPSESEGFGLPVIEALACGTPVIASDLPVLREIGENAISYCPVADIPAWNKAATDLIGNLCPQSEVGAQRKKIGLLHAAKFSWACYASKMTELYSEIWLSRN